jgi:hypothetical protein
MIIMATIFALLIGITFGMLLSMWQDGVKKSQMEDAATHVHLGDLSDNLCKSTDGKNQANAAQTRELVGELGKRWRGQTWEQNQEEALAIRKRAGIS